MKQLAMASVLAALISLLSIVIYDRFIVKRTVKPLRIGVVDVTEVFRKKEAEFARHVTSKETTDQDRENAIVMAQRFSQDMASTLASLPVECDCIVLPRSAIAGVHPDIVDLTPELKRRVGL